MKATLLLFALASPAPRTAPVAPKIAFSESLRYETMTKSGGGFGSSWSETETASRTKLTISAEMPIDGVRVDGDTPLSIQVGDFAYSGTLKDDASYRPSGTSARLTQTATTGTNGVRTVLARVELQWSADRLKVKVVADQPNSGGATAMAFREAQIGPFEAVTKASLGFGGRKIEFDVPIKGRIGRRSVDSFEISGSATTVDLKGEAKG